MAEDKNINITSSFTPIISSSAQIGPDVVDQSSSSAAHPETSKIKPPDVKPKPKPKSILDPEERRTDLDIDALVQLEAKQHGIFKIDTNLEGMVDKTKAIKEEFRRQSIANEQYFVKDAPPLDLNSLNTSTDPNKYIFNVEGLKGVEVVNLLRCVIIEYKDRPEQGPFFFQFADDKKFKLELLPTGTQPGNGLIKTVGRLKYYSYPDMCHMLKSGGVTSKGLGIMLQKLNTTGLKSALHNQISPMNELHFMLLFEIAKRLVRGPHGYSLSTEPELDQLPIGVTVARMISLFCKGKSYLDYEDVFGSQDKYNPFTDSSVVLRRQKICALNKAFFEFEIKTQEENEFIGKFLKYHNGYVLKTVEGYLEELDMAFRGL
ncbi:uncharacterized protein LOC116302677 [Actinia tenebrosa]|uniref:Uncharacterized protein LOC116302677 n=1 Tax=Actinia tenebrosa TaxID=6105 RepID=A0A6P8ILP4_ACTTE|nr:uncharacterized protein LOC116302677 [Actinia tenebrosa]